MPVYAYICACGHRVDEYRRVADWTPTRACPVCGHSMTQDIVGQSRRQAVRGNYKKPIISDSMGFLAVQEDVDEHRRRFPDIDLDIDNGCARPVFRSLAQKRKYMKAMNWADTRDFVA